MARLWTVEEARAEVPRVRAVADEVIVLRARIVEGATRHDQGDESVVIADLKAWEARLAELLDGMRADGIEIKGWAPLLVDFPALLEGREVLLCWLEGETDLGWYHEPAHGFAGRRRLPPA